MEELISVLSKFEENGPTLAHVILSFAGNIISEIVSYSHDLMTNLRDLVELVKSTCVSDPISTRSEMSKNSEALTNRSVSCYNKLNPAHRSRSVTFNPYTFPFSGRSDKECSPFPAL